MQLLHKNQENFCLPTVFQMGPGKKNRPFWPTFWIFEPNRTQPRHPKIDFEISIFRFSKSDFRTSRDPCFRIFSKKCVFRGSVCENEKVNLGIAPQLFLSSNRARKRYKNIACSQRKVSRIRPRETHFSKKFQKVQKTHFFEKSGFPKWKSISAKKFAFFSPFWARKSATFEKKFPTRFFDQPPSVLGWVRKSKKWVKKVDFFSRAPFEKWLEGKNSPDFYVATASIFEPFRFNLGAESTF